MGAEHFGDLQVVIQMRVVFFCFRTEKQTNKRKPKPEVCIGQNRIRILSVAPHFVILEETVTVSVLPFLHLQDEHYTMPWHVALLGELSPTLMELATVIC